MNEKVKMHSHILRWLLKTTGKSKYGILGVTLCRAMISSGVIFSALVIKNVIDGAVAGDKHGFLSSLLLCGVIFLIQDLLAMLSYHLEEVTSFQIEKQLKSHIYHHLLVAEYKNLEKWHTGELMNHLNGDVGIISSNMLSILPGLVSMLIKLVGSVSILILWDWRFCAVFLAAGVLMLSASVLVRKTMKRLHHNVREQYDYVQSFQQETIENIMMIRSFLAEGRAEKILNARMNHLKKARMKRTMFSNLCYGGLNGVIDLSYLFGLLWCGFGILNGSISFGTTSAVLQLIGQLQQPFSNISSYLPQYYALSVSAERLMKLQNLPMEQNSAPIERENFYHNLSAIHVRELSFSYGRTPVLQDASLSIYKGNFIAFIGESGIGKSTLLKHLLAFYSPKKGSLTFTDSDGNSFPVTAAARNLFSYVPQGNFLMSGTIYDAIAFLNPTSDFSEDEKQKIQEVCRIACADTFIQAMPLKYETVIGEHGAGLSEGQLQRLAIARALYTGAPILLLDEATSALDEMTERQVLKNIRDMNEKTVLIVTHKNMALSICDRIIHIKDFHFTEDFRNE